MCDARCAPAASAGAASPAAMRPTRAATTLSEDRWRALATERQRPGAVFAGTVRACKCPGGGPTGRPFRLVEVGPFPLHPRSEEPTSELQSLMRISYAVFCLKQKRDYTQTNRNKGQHDDTAHCNIK